MTRMKFSQFNAIVPYKNKYALYNSFNQNVMFLIPELKELLTAAVNEGIENLESYHPEFYRYLVEQSYVVDSADNEVDKVKEISKRVDENEDTFLLTVNPTMNCNFKCYYCYETHVKQSKLSVDIITRINRFVDATVEKPSMKNFALSFFGGEPLLYFTKTVVPLIDHFIVRCREKKIPFDLGFTTNGYLVNQDFIDYFRNRNITCALQITLDGYKEEHDKVRYVTATKGSYDEIIKNIRLLITNKFFVRLRINFTDVNIHNTHKITAEFSDIDPEIIDQYLIFDFHRVWQNNKIDDTIIDLNRNIDSIRQDGFHVTGQFSANNVIESCYADKRNSAVVNYNGDIYKCTARDFTKPNRAGYINDSGELIWEDGYLEKRMDIKFKNKPCLSCKILPLCNGGCSQHAMERLGTDYCVYSGDENEKNKVVYAKIEELLNGVPVKEVQAALAI
jgi:uncharacterized protein